MSQAQNISHYLSFLLTLRMGLDLRFEGRKEERQVKFNTVHYNTTRIIYKNGKNIDVIKESRIISTHHPLKKLINKIYKL